MRHEGETQLDSGAGSHLRRFHCTEDGIAKKMLCMAAARSLQGSTVIPALRYRDAHAALEWLERVLGFTRQALYEGPNHTVAHAQLTRGGGMVMLGSASNPSPAREWVGLDE